MATSSLGKAVSRRPAYYDPKDNYAGYYAPRMDAVMQAGQEAQSSPAKLDKIRTLLLLVDFQVDFCAPDGNLSVPGALKDVQNTVEFVYDNLDSITTIAASLDSHVPISIFFPNWWRYQDDRTQPAPYTQIKRLGGALVGKNDRPIMAMYDVIWSMNYVEYLETVALKPLMIWPYHTLIGTPGHALVASLSEAIGYHAAARLSQPIYIEKGKRRRTEHYGIWKAEKVDPEDPSTAMNADMLNLLATYERIYIAGEAKSHCVLETKKQTLEYFANQPDVIRRITFLTDCTSDVVHPEIDFAKISAAEDKRMERLGVKLAVSTDRI